MIKDPFKVIIYFEKWGESRFHVKAERIVMRLATEPMLTLVPDPLPRLIPTRAALLTALAEYSAAKHVAADGSKSAIKDRIQKRGILTQMLKDFAPHLEATAKEAGDITILLQGGYDLRKPNVKSPTNGTPPQPVITVKRGPVSGSVIARVKPLLTGITTYEAQCAVGDPTVDANFKGSFISKTGSRITFTGLPVATFHRIRVRGIGSAGPGDWSNPASIIVT